MNELFGPRYANIYDLMYGSKSYDSEIDVIKRSFAQADGNVRSVLDLGCGTGGHAVPLALLGLDVVGVDRSAAMLKKAKRKKPLSGSGPYYVQGDVRRIPLSHQFDAAMMMFAVLSYQTSNEDVLNALRSVRKCLRPGGVLMGDFWYGPAVLRLGPEDRFRVFRAGNGELLKSSKGRLDTSRHVCIVDVEHWLISGGSVLDKGSETHEVRYFFPQELRFVLQASGFELVSLSAFPDGGPADDSVWNAFFVARAIGTYEDSSPGSS